MPLFPLLAVCGSCLCAVPTFLHEIAEPQAVLAAVCCATKEERPGGVSSRGLLYVGSLQWRAQACGSGSMRRRAKSNGLK